MIYKLEPIPAINPLLPWMYVFMCLSLKHFKLIYDKLDFPFDPPEDLRQLSHDFALTRHIMNPIPEYATATKNLLSDPVHGVTSINLLEGTSPDDSYSRKRELLFTNTFSRLEKMGYAENIYRWGKQTHTFYKYTNRHKDIDALHAWCRLLREWAVLEWLKQPVASTHELYSDGMDKVVARYAPIYTDVPPKPFIPLRLEPLHLSLETRVILQAIILHHEARNLLFETMLDEIKAASKDAWEDFAFKVGTGGGTWIILQGHFRIDLHEWCMLVETLSSDEMHTLEEWALQHQERHRDLCVLPAYFRVLNSNADNATLTT